MADDLNPAEERAAIDLFENAQDLPEPQRTAFLEAAENVSDRVRQRALDLLRTQDRDSRQIATGGAAALIGEEPMPDRIGAYRIVDCLGRGGMGAVYLGERSANDFDHRVAIKVIKPGALSDELAERFRRERQILAQLSHKHIARLYDGGETDDGSPYIVMEYVGGIPLYRWIEERTPGHEQRLALFRQICDAVGFAHQNLIVHRDLTPANILVQDDGEAKLIDFGISRSREEAEPAEALDDMSATPGFAAPERASSHAATTLADIFSLGRILDLLAGDEKSEELAAIVARACDADPEHRYPTVGALVRDLELLRTGYPVEAFGGGTGYRLRKFVSRQRLLVGFAATILLLLTVGLAVTGWAYDRAETARAEAETRFSEVRALAGFALFDHLDTLSRIPGTTEARAELAERAQRYLANLTRSPRAGPDLLLEAARGYVRLARIVGVPGQPTLGDAEEARAHLEQGEALLAQIAGNGAIAAAEIAPVEALARISAANILILEDHDMESGQAAIEEAREILAAVPADQRTADHAEASRWLRYVELEHADQIGEPDRVRELADAMVSDIDGWPEEMRGGDAERRDRGYYYYWLGRHHYAKGEFGEAIVAFGRGHELLSEAERQLPNDPMLLYLIGWTDYQGGGAADALGDRARTRRFLDDALAAVEQLRAVQQRDGSVRRLWLNIRESESQFRFAGGDQAGGIAAQEGIVAEQARVMRANAEPSEAVRLAMSQAILAYMQIDSGRRSAACVTLGEARRLLAPYAAENRLPGFMQNAAERLPSTITRCRAGQSLGEISDLFEDWG